MKKDDILIYIVFAFVAYMLVNNLKNGFKNMFGTIGIGNTLEDEQREKEITKNENNVRDYFNPNYWQSISGAKLFTKSFTDKIVKDIYNAIGYVYDNPEQVLSAFKRCKYKTQISWIAYNFDLKYKKDLFAYLDSKLDTDEQRRVWNDILIYVKSLPKGN